MQANFSERRGKSRTVLEQMVRIRPLDPQLPPEYCTTFNVSSRGVFFATWSGHYTLGMNVYVTVDDVEPASPMNRSGAGAVVRVEKLENGQFGVAVQLLSTGTVEILKDGGWRWV